ncbi:MAG TPA: 1,4-dihydroxy-2-naphthoate polyprenyltransferase [Myxococcaceae bacterium]|nr:1,4-dihydroxy-2-naphthoate polyprenyltransferase [Myxococcaceae bacterium]
MSSSHVLSAPRPGVATWVLAARPKTLAAAVVPVCLGTALAWGVGKGSALPALAALAGAVFIQIGTNLANDYFDFKKGADTADRLGPTRVTQAGLVAPSAVLAGAVAVFAAAFGVGVYLTAVAGWPIAIIGLLALASGWAYTGGPYPLGYHGLGDLWVFIFFGLVAVAGTYYAQALELTPLAVAAGVPPGAIATGLLAVNNLRDIETDARAGKRTLVVRFGMGAGRGEYAALLALAYATPVAIWAAGWSGPWTLLALLSLPAAIGPLRTVLRERGAALNAAIGGTARLLAVYGALFSAGLFLGAR